MSAFIVSQRHIDALISAGLSSSRYGNLRWRRDDEYPELTHETASAVGSMLWAENVASVEGRYSHLVEAGESLPGSYKLETIADGVTPVEVPEWVSEYRYSHYSAKSLPPVAALKAIDCYEYQSCEHAEWEGSEAKSFCESLRSALIGQLPGYDEAKWSIG